MTRSTRFVILLALIGLTISVASHAQVAVGISVRVGPPALPVYVQPVCPGPGYIWTPGYWAYGPDGYFWVPGTWVEPPEVGLLWTPGYWGWRNGFYVWNAGYWGPHVGFYGGINYGFGYTGVGFAGGYWRDRVFYYNRSVTNVNVVNIHNTYNTTVINNTTINRVSYNGGGGGTRALPTAAERNAAQEHHFEATALQTQHHQAAGLNRAQLASVNHGQPGVAASPRAGVFSGQGVVAGNRHENFQKFSPNNAAPRSGGNTSSSPNTFSNKGNGAHNGMNGNNSAYNPERTYERSTQNNARMNNSRVNNARVNDPYMNNSRVNNARVNDAHMNNSRAQGHNGGQHGNNSGSNDKRDRR